MIFRYDQLREFFKALKDLGTTQRFRDWQGDNVFLMRHDVDFDIKLAHQLAVIEQEAGIVSTFFILTTCESYNVLCDRNRNLLRELVAMGHEIGLHFDPRLYRDELDPAVRREVELLSFAADQAVRSISLHNPSIHGQYPMFEGYINAYDTSMFSDDNYISDSLYLFRGKNPFEFIKNIDKHMIQILLHPMHYSASGGGYDEVIVDTFARYMQEIHTNFLVNSTYKEQVGEDFMTTFKNRIS